MCYSPDEQLDFTVPESRLPDALPTCDVPSAVSQGLPQMEQHWHAMITKLKDVHRAETELMGIVEDFDGLLGDNQKMSAMSVIGRRIAHGLKQVWHLCDV